MQWSRIAVPMNVIRVGLLRERLACRSCHISAYAEMRTLTTVRCFPGSKRSHLGVDISEE